MRVMSDWRKVLAALLLIVIAASGCDTQSAAGSSVDEQLACWEGSLRGEAEWLWEGMSYANTHGIAGSTPCEAHSFAHRPVTLDDAARRNDSAAGTMADDLAYAAQGVREARAQWEAYCQGNLFGSHAADAMQSWLLPTFDALNRVNARLSERAAARVKR